MMVPEKRGAALSIQAFGGMMGPAIGPVAGAFLSEGQGWRWVLWLVTILVRLGKQPIIYPALLTLPLTAYKKRLTTSRTDTERHHNLLRHSTNARNQRPKNPFAQDQPPP